MNTHTLIITHYDHTEFSFDVTHEEGIKMALQASEQAEKVMKWNSTSFLHHMDIYFDIYEEGCIKLVKIEDKHNVKHYGTKSNKA